MKKLHILFIFFIGITLNVNANYNQKVITSIEVFVFNPKITESFARIPYTKLINGLSGEEKNNDKNYYYKKFDKRSTINKISNQIDGFISCKAAEESDINARIVLKLNCSDGTTEIIVLEHVKSQRIYYNKKYLQRNPKFYKLILRQLPLRFKNGVKAITTEYSC